MRLIIIGLKVFYMIYVRIYTYASFQFYQFLLNDICTIHVYKENIYLFIFLQAAILQQTAEYIYQLEQEKTRLLSQNCQLKRLLNHQQHHADAEGEAE